ncbi:amylo-alpha-1,6-glucosidase [Azospirillum rugosum]|uniref:Glycogen debranching enzyme n=1 Tax=Azospirillum rugosum TaxID=416170 RepID=A0ABS4SQP6_9PROT|nr:amylo-alpha-1,6-glucosidase [Azospirillum rugosum]MBP2294879.1 putative glycogen debranching enzyme [Azospirillum rugosum]MDQ0528199.1 putative glycogen debranching enzyme [Azospirillum rugosum]
MADFVRKIERDVLQSAPDAALSREWLVANGLGGYASSSLSGAVTRRYHGLLVAALPAPLGRVVMLSQVNDVLIQPDGTERRLGSYNPDPDHWHNGSPSGLTEFRMEAGLPVWRYDFDGVVIEKQVVMPHRQNIVHVTYRIVKADQPVHLRLRPVLAFRKLEAAVDQPLARDYRITARGHEYEVWAGPDLPVLRMAIEGAELPLTLDGGARRDVFYSVEADRGYESRGSLWSPGFFSGPLSQGQTISFVAATESWQRIWALPPDDVLRFETERRRRLVHTAHPALREGAMAELVLSADSFIFVPAGRVADQMRARAEGDEVRTVIAGYHWFTDWGRDTMISLEGLTLTTGRHVEAGWILRTFAHYIRQGLIPNMFPDGKDEGLYHTADATLWFFHALNRYLRATNDRHTLQLLLPKLLDVIDQHRRGTRFGIGVDPRDGLLRQGQEGYQLTWMDAKVEDWVVTPRRGKAVEINALWYNALRLTSSWLTEEGEADAARPLEELAEQARVSFNKRFWCEHSGHLYDVVDGEQGDDASCRPNQIFAISLDNPVLDRSHWEPVVETVRQKLLTPVGLRSLAPGSRDYKPKYFGDLRARDAAYHQGTVWGWLIGPYVDAWLKVHPDDHAGARELLKGFIPHLDEAGIGTIAEIFDAEPPFRPRGCISQAWSVAEVLRCWAATAPNQ